MYIRTAILCRDVNNTYVQNQNNILCNIKLYVKFKGYLVIILFIMRLLHTQSMLNSI